MAITSGIRRAEGVRGAHFCAGAAAVLSRSCCAVLLRYAARLTPLYFGREGVRCGSLKGAAERSR